MPAALIRRNLSLALRLNASTPPALTGFIKQFLDQDPTLVITGHLRVDPETDSVYLQHPEDASNRLEIAALDSIGRSPLAVVLRDRHGAHLVGGQLVIDSLHAPVVDLQLLLALLGIRWENVTPDTQRLNRYENAIHRMEGCDLLPWECELSNGLRTENDPTRHLKEIEERQADTVPLQPQTLTIGDHILKRWATPDGLIAVESARRGIYFYPKNPDGDLPVTPLRDPAALARALNAAQSSQKVIQD